MAAPRDADLPTNVYHRATVRYTGPTALGLAGTAITFAGTQPGGTGFPVYGILEHDAVQNTDVTIAVAGICQIISANVIAIGDTIAFNVLGQAVSVTAGSQLFGRALTAAAVAGQKIQVLITREGTN